MRPTEVPAEMPDSSPRLLLVEDDPIGAEWLLHTLRGWGLLVEHAQDCAQALAHRDLQAFDGLLLDQRLPDGEGCGLLAALRLRGARGRALALSADLDSAHRQRLIEAGFAACLCKPVEPGALLGALTRLALSPPQWDEARALACANGRASIVQSLRRLMLAELPAQRAALRAASSPADSDPGQLDALLHRMLGAARLTGAAALAAHIESARAALQPEIEACEVQRALARLDAEIECLLEETVERESLQT